MGLAALGLLAVAVLTDIGDPRPSEDTAEEPSSQGTGSASSGPIPDDVDDPRPTVDLTAVPSGEDGADPVTVARWWAATYIAYVGAEPSDAVIARLAPVTTDTLAAALAAIPPPASYDDAPAPIDGVSSRPPTQEDDGIGVRVTVDTGAATVTYDLTLVERPNPGEDQTAWVVNRAERL